MTSSKNIQDSRKTVSLVLGSGGARGMAHVGVIKWLESHHFSIQSISGCSIGALVGAAYATQSLDEFVSWLEGFKRIDIYNMLDFILGSEGFVKGDKVMDAIEEIIGTTPIEDLPIRYTAVAADIAKEREVWLDSGPVSDAIRASISLPLFFTPHEINGVKLIDGGILNPTPIEPTLGDETDLTIAVNLGGLPEIKPKAPKQDAVEEEGEDEEKKAWQQTIDEYLQIVQQYRAKTSDQWSMFYIADQSFNTMQNAIARQKMELNPPDYLIDVPRNKCGTLDFDRSAELIEYGYEMAEKTLGHLV